MTEGRMLVLSAPSGSGKGTVIRELLAQNPDISPSVSFTSRAPRQGERDGVHYFFVSADRFREMIDAGEFIEWDQYQGNYYGTSRIKVEHLIQGGADVVFDITIKGAFAIRTQFPQAALVFIVPPSFSELERRLRKRGTETEEKINGRLAEARREIMYLDRFDYYIINDDILDAAKKLGSILVAQKCRVRPEEAASIVKSM